MPRPDQRADIEEIVRLRADLVTTRERATTAERERDAVTQAHGEVVTLLEREVARADALERELAAVCEPLDALLQAASLLVAPAEAGTASQLTKARATVREQGARMVEIVRARGAW